MTIPTLEEARAENKANGIDTKPLIDWALKKQQEVKQKNCDHEWKMTWPNDPIEHTCDVCGLQQLK